MVVIVYTGLYRLLINRFIFSFYFDERRWNPENRCASQSQEEALLRRHSNGGSFGVKLPG